MGKHRKQMVRYVGMDIHKEIAVSCIIDEKGTVLQRQRCRCTREALEHFSHQYLQATDKVALEATTKQPPCARQWLRDWKAREPWHRQRRSATPCMGR
jgi:hypothetical protein